jgi:hypothetical protein
MNAAAWPLIPPPPRRILRVAILSLLVVGTVAVCIFREPLRNLILAKGVNEKSQSQLGA